MDEFDIELFTGNPTLLVLDSLRKTDLLAIAQHYKLSTNTTQKKGDVKKLIWEYLIDVELVSEEETESPRDLHHFIRVEKPGVSGEREGASWG